MAPIKFCLIGLHLAITGSLLLLLKVQQTNCSLRDTATLQQGADGRIVTAANLPEIAKNLVETTDNDIKSLPHSFDVNQLQPRAGILNKIGGFVKKAIAPAQEYVTAVNRYHKWFNNYRAFQKASTRKVPDAMDVLKLEYATLEAEMIEEEAAKRAEETPSGVVPEGEVFDDDEEEEPLQANNDQEKPADGESMDFVLRVLKRLIDRLERRLKKMESLEGIDVDVEDITPDGQVSEEAVKKAMERMKKAVVKSAKETMTQEMTIIARTAAFNGMASFMAAKPDVGDALDHLRPIIFLVGSATTPVAVSYLMSIEFRAALAVFDRLNPMTGLLNKWKENRNKKQ